MGDRIWGDRIHEYESLNKTDLLEMIENLKIKNNELTAALEYQKRLTEISERSQNITCEELGRYVVENHELKNKIKQRNIFELKNLPTLEEIDTMRSMAYLKIMVERTEFYKNNDDPTDPRD